MKKSDLKSGMLTLNAKGEYGLVLLNTENGDVIAGNGCSESDWRPLNSLNDDLESTLSDDRSIVAVYKAPSNKYRASFDVSERELLWKRKDNITKVPLNHEYTAEVKRDKREVKVGCQTFSFDKIYEIVAAMEK